MADTRRGFLARLLAGATAGLLASKVKATEPEAPVLHVLPTLEPQDWALDGVYATTNAEFYFTATGGYQVGADGRLMHLGAVHGRAYAEQVNDLIWREIERQ
jgi:hypothetical protein